ncbi:hypothetical protein HOG21_00740 [bacterium]|nr:hypothetical protein [bacterium]
MYFQSTGQAYIFTSFNRLCNLRTFCVLGLSPFRLKLAYFITGDSSNSILISLVFGTTFHITFLFHHFSALNNHS